jgi:hypothetical protein
MEDSMAGRPPQLEPKEVRAMCDRHAVVQRLCRRLECVVGVVERGSVHKEPHPQPTIAVARQQANRGNGACWVGIELVQHARHLAPLLECLAQASRRKVCHPFEERDETRGFPRELHASTVGGVV